MCVIFFIICVQVESKTEEEYEKEEEEIEAPPPKKVIRVDPKFARGSAYGAWTTIREEPYVELRTLIISTIAGYVYTTG